VSRALGKSSLVLLLAVPMVCCGKSQSGATSWEASKSQAAILQAFRERASPRDLREFDRLCALGDPVSQTRATEMVLFKLRRDELAKIGVTQVIQDTRVDWAIAWCCYSTETRTAILQAFKRHRVEAFASCGLNRAGWYVAREEFFRAQAILLDSNVEALGVEIVKPAFRLP